LKSTSCSEIAQELLERCIARNPPSELPRALVEEPCGRSLFGILVEGLADRFDPVLCNSYARLFSQALAYVRNDVDAPSLVSRYDRVRWTRPIAGKPRKVFVLSRVTLGADIAVTSVMLAASKRRFPHAELVFVGPKKNYELFAADPHVHHVLLEYRRGGLRDRLAVWDPLKELLSAPDSVVIDPDSRLTQLGLLPVCPENRYHLFESRAYGADSNRPLPELASAWAGETFGVNGAQPYVALGPKPSGSGSYISVSLGVGENMAKRVPDPFEQHLLTSLAATGIPLCVDRGAGGEEAERVSRAVQLSGAKTTYWSGSFAGFAGIIAGSRLYIGYDSAGQHVAAACGIPLISIFAGFPDPRMFDRWRPTGPHSTVVRVDRPDPAWTMQQVDEALAKVLEKHRS
jgi:ADP-heptose:LPS heptosyltransferase